MKYLLMSHQRGCVSVSSREVLVGHSGILIGARRKGVHVLEQDQDSTWMVKKGSGGLQH